MTITRTISGLTMIIAMTACGLSSSNEVGESSFLSHESGESQLEWKSLRHLECSNGRDQIMTLASENGVDFVLNSNKYKSEAASRKELRSFKTWSSFSNATGIVAYVSSRSLKGYTLGARGWKKSICKEVEQAKVKEGEFLMTASKNFQPSGCDILESLSLSNPKTGPLARIRTTLLGECEIFVLPQDRIYSLSVKSRSCGSVIYSGSLGTSQGGNPPKEITITDHRKRTCEDIVAAKVILEYDLGENKLIRYSNDLADEPIRMCTADFGYLYNPKTNKCGTFTNGCIRAELFRAGYVTAPADKCDSSR